MNNPEDSVAKELLEVQRTLGWMDLVIGSIDDAVYVTDKDNHIVFANQYFSDLLNIPRVFLLGHDISDVFDVKIDNKLTSEIVFLNKNSDEEAAIYRWKIEKKKYIFKISKRYIRTTKQMVYLAKDITREQELASMKNSFINLASHQLRTPMTSIMLNSHILSDMYNDDTSPSQPKEVAQAIARSSERMIRLINDILNITRIQNESLNNMNTEDINLGAIVDIVHNDLSSHIHTKNLSFTKDFPDSLPLFKCDSGALHEIISNLVTNAVQYTPASGTITISADINTEHVVIAVKDTGIGIPLKYANQIYDQFARADNAFETFNEGTGLGLYLVKLLLLKINGTIDYKSKVNVGTTFTVKIPYVQ